MCGDAGLWRQQANDALEPAEPRGLPPFPCLLQQLAVTPSGWQVSKRHLVSKRGVPFNSENTFPYGP